MELEFQELEDKFKMKLNLTFENNIDLEKPEIYSFGILILDFYGLFDNFSTGDNEKKNLINQIRSTIPDSKSFKESI